MMQGKAMRPTEPILWDLGIRLFHWSLVVAVGTALSLGYFGPPVMTWHFWAGYAVVGLLVFRFAWGLVGPPNAWFRTFAFEPQVILSAIVELPARRSRHWAGHNPLGGLAVLFCLALLTVQVASGLLADDEVFNVGPFAKFASDAVRLKASAIHDLGGYLIPGWIGLHLSAIAFHAIWKRENLVWAMIVGRRSGF